MKRHLDCYMYISSHYFQHVKNVNSSVMPEPFNKNIDSASYIGLEKADDLPDYLSVSYR